MDYTIRKVDGKIVGAVWVRIINDYGHIDNETPSLAISLYKEYRGFGIGTAMIKEILALLKSHGYKQVSLSVQKANYAANLYLKVGFEIIRELEVESRSHYQKNNLLSIFFKNCSYVCASQNF